MNTSTTLPLSMLSNFCVDQKIIHECGAKDDSEKQKRCRHYKQNGTKCLYLSFGNWCQNQDAY